MQYSSHTSFSGSALIGSLREWQVLQHGALRKTWSERFLQVSSIWPELAQRVDEEVVAAHAFILAQRLHLHRFGKAAQVLNQGGLQGIPGTSH